MIFINGRFLTQRLTGVQRFAFEMVKGLLDTSKEKICILIPPKNIDDSYDIGGWPIKTIGLNLNALWEQLDLPFFLSINKNPLLINLVNTAPAFYKNQIVSILDMTTFVNPKWFSKTFVKYYKLVVPLIAKHSHKIITISEHSKNDIVKFLNTNPEKIEVIYCGIANQFKEQSLSPAGNTIIFDLGLRHNNYILAVSSLDPRKNFKRLIEAYNLLTTAIPLVIVGAKGKVFADDGLRDLVSNSGNKIIFTGYVNDLDLITLYKSALCFIYPSLYEGFGMPPLEAMACGCATIVSNTSSIPEVCGSAGLYVDPVNIESINSAMLKILEDDDLRKSLIDHGFEQVKKYSWESSAQKIISLIEEFI